jgi:hypothetical protein
MTATEGRRLPLLYCPSTRRVPEGLERRNLTELRKRARHWLDADRAKRLPKDPLVAALRRALQDDAAAARVLGSLSPQERAAASVYRRYGGSVDGAIIRLDLTARGLLEVVQKRYSDYYTRTEWKHNPIDALAERWVLLAEGPEESYYYSSYGYGYGHGPETPLPRYSLHAGIAERIEPAGPAPWPIPPATGPAEAITRRSPAEVALDLSRVFAYVAGRGSIKARKDGAVAVPTLRAMEKAVPLDDGSDLRLPDPHGLYLELLRHAGVLRFQGGAIVADAAAAARQLAATDVEPMTSWARGWLSARDWWDGIGAPEGRDYSGFGEQVLHGRQALAWALGCLARAGDHWFELGTFLARIRALQGEARGFYLPSERLAWDPKLVAPRDQGESGDGARRREPLGRWGAWYANAVMVTLVALGLVERARLGGAAAAPHAFRLTESGRAVFGAPEVAPPPEPAPRRCLVVQPNFDIVAYLDQADARTAGLLGRIAASGSAHSGPVQTFHLTQASVYQAEESGLGHAQIVDFLRQHSQREPPANVLRALADWSGRRESLAVRSGVTVRAFPTTADRDAYLKDHPGTACGERFVLGTGRGQDSPGPGAVVSDHLADCRRTLELDEQGQIRTTRPVDLVQGARLSRLARPTAMGWQLTAASMRRAAAGGLKPGVVHRWLADHLSHPMPPLMAVAIDAWLRAGKSRPLELADAVLLHVPDADQFRAIAASRRLRPFLLARPGPGWLIVKKEARKELAAALEDLGFSLTRELTHDEPNPAGAPPGTAEDD